MELDDEFQKIDQENKKELLAIRDKEEKARVATINMKSANCDEKGAYYADILKSSKGMENGY